MAAPDDGVARSHVPSPPYEAVQDDELDALFAPLAAFQTLILAVSGGADSVAMMMLVQRWIQRRGNAPKLFVATVDHGLREESAAEVEWVGQQARALGIDAKTLIWDGDKPLSGIQDAARGARYRLLSEFAASAGPMPVAVVTAHTEDDQAETLLMRLARGSGLDGLTAMPVERAAFAALNEVALVRPLLGISGGRLRATLRAAGQSWIDDPSNDAERFERVRVRKARGLLAEIGLENDKLALSARRLARAKDALEACVDDLERASRLDVHGGAFASFEFAVWLGAPEELGLRLLGRIIGAFGGQSEPVNLGQLEALVRRVSDTGFEGATLGGAAISRHSSDIRVQRELGRTSLPSLALAPGSGGIWDNRFRVRSATRSPGTVEVRALGPDGYGKLRREFDLPASMPASAGATLPAFWRDGEVLFVAVLGELPDANERWKAVRGLYSAEFLE